MSPVQSRDNQRTLLLQFHDCVNLLRQIQSFCLRHGSVAVAFLFISTTTFTDTQCTSIRRRTKLSTRCFSVVSPWMMQTIRQDCEKKTSRARGKLNYKTFYIRRANLNSASGAAWHFNLRTQTSSASFSSCLLI